MKIEHFDNLIIGAGPSGLSAGIELLKVRSMKVAIIEKGNPLTERYCSVLKGGKCTNCPVCSLLSGVGGASALLGGKLCFFPAGERLNIHTGYGFKNANIRIISFMKKIGLDTTKFDIKKIFNFSKYNNVDNIHLKEYFSISILQRSLYYLFYLLKKSFISLGGIIKTNSFLTDISPGPENFRFKVHYNEKGIRKIALVRNSIIIGTGRVGTRGLTRLFKMLNIKFSIDTVDVGIRLEIPNDCLKGFIPHLEDPKFKIEEGTNDEIRTLCWCRGGQTSITNIYGTCLVDGHFGNHFEPFSSVSIVSRLKVPTGYKPLTFALEQFDSVLRSKAPIYQGLNDFLNYKKTRALTSSNINGTQYKFGLKKLVLRLIKWVNQI